MPGIEKGQNWNGQYRLRRFAAQRNETLAWPFVALDWSIRTQLAGGTQTSRSGQSTIQWLHGFGMVRPAPAGIAVAACG